MENYIDYIGYAVAILTLIVTVYKSHKAGKTYAEIITIIINVLKDENKLINGKFSPETLKKAEEIANVLTNDSNAIERVKDALNGSEKDIAIASIKGKKIFLSDVLKIGGIYKIFRK